MFSYWRIFLQLHHLAHKFTVLSSDQSLLDMLIKLRVSFMVTPIWTNLWLILILGIIKLLHLSDFLPVVSHLLAPTNLVLEYMS